MTKLEEIKHWIAQRRECSLPDGTIPRMLDALEVAIDEPVEREWGNREIRDILHAHILAALTNQSEGDKS